MGRSPAKSQPVQPKRSKGEQQKEPERQRQDELLDEALEETFPASDPIAPGSGRGGN